jgi:molybdenum cofactor biosynthesis protein B
MSIAVATITVSDTRNMQTDSGGALLRELLEAGGYTLTQHTIVVDSFQSIQSTVSSTIDSKTVRAIVLTGGTGIGPRDVTIEAVEPLYQKRMDGFGEAFRRLSWDEVGVRSLMSRASAGVAKGCLVIALPGNPKAVRLGVEKILLPMIEHAVKMLDGGGHEHKH